VIIVAQKPQKSVESTSQQSSLNQPSQQQQQQQQPVQSSNRNLISTTSSSFQTSNVRLFGSMTQQPTGNCNHKIEGVLLL
jgi:hypothetical protein